MENKINFEYLRLFKEAMLLALVTALSRFRRIRKQKDGIILIVNTCLIGEFMASLPAIRDFIRKQKGKRVDMIVSPPLAGLAEKIIGIGKIFTARSNYARATEEANSQHIPSEKYEKIIVLRVSPEAYQIIKKIPAADTSTSFWPVLKYTIHLLYCLALRRYPKPWRTVNSEVLGSLDNSDGSEEIFQFSPADYKRLESLSLPGPTSKNIIIHTGTNWRMKRWGNDKWAALLKHIHSLGDFNFIFIGHKNDQEDYENISARLNFPTLSLIGRVDLAELALVFQTSVGFFIGIDSGPSNMSYIFGIKTLTILDPGPHMYLPSNPRNIIIDKSRGHGLWQMFFYQKTGFIDKIQPEEVYQVFIRHLI